MPIHPGDNGGRKPKIGPQITLTLPQQTLTQIDQTLQQARKTYKRLPRHYKTRSAYLRHLIHQTLNQQQPSKNKS